MIEPQPKIVKKSELSNKQVRIGLILQEDHLTNIELHTLEVSCILQDETVLRKKNTYMATLDGDEITLCDSEGERIYAANKITISSQESSFPSGSLSISPIIAGRTFHWKKEISATFPGDFELEIREGVIQLINILPFEEYLACVVVSEMSSGAPLEFVKAQTIAARSWAACFLNEKHPQEDFELCNDDDCQRYHGVTFADPHSLQASLETCGEYLLSEQDHVVPGYYSKSCGGVTEDPKDCFGFSVNGLTSITDGTSLISPGDLEKWISLPEEEAASLWCGGDKKELEKLLGGVDDLGEYFRWTHQESKEALASYLNEKTEVTDALRVSTLEPLQRGSSGRILELKIGYENYSGETAQYLARTQYEIRSLLHPSFLYSSAIAIIDKDSDFHFHGAGWGHGVGFCQIGASFQALAGRTYTEILNIYFPKAIVSRCYS